MSTEISKSYVTQPIHGYAGQILRVDLTKGESIAEHLNEHLLRKYVGGASLGVKYIFDEVPPGIQWSDPENHLFIGSGPLGGTRVKGSGSIAVVTKGALTNGMTSTQANGFFGAFLRSSGFDGIVLQGAAPSWVYLYIRDGVAEIRDASHIVSKDTIEVDRIIKEELHKKEREMSVLCIGPAGENLVKFACISADSGHMASHNGVGAIMGSKKLKAIAVERGRNSVVFKDKEAISQLSKELSNIIMGNRMYSLPSREGTVGGVVMGTAMRFVPVKNYTTSIHAIDSQKLSAYTAENIRSKFKAKKNPCWACSANHCHTLEITQGKYKGRIIDEPEYEGMAAFSSLIGVDDVTTSIVLASEVDRLGMDVNESGWVIAWLMECYEKGVLTKKTIDGLDMTWGNGEAVMAMLNKIAKREGFGDVLADGVMRAATHVGGEALNFAVHTKKGNTPRGHDHRVMTFEQFDTCVSNLGTIESSHQAPFKQLGLSESNDFFDPEVLPIVVAKVKGAMIFDDSLVTCRFQTFSLVDVLCQLVNAATGWNMDIDEAMNVGKRAVNLARLFNLQNGIGAELDAPSIRYGSTPLDGLAAGKSTVPHWDKMLHTYYYHMGWDENGKPLPETLRSLGIEDIVAQVPNNKHCPAPENGSSYNARPESGKGGING